MDDVATGSFRGSRPRDPRSARAPPTWWTGSARADLLRRQAPEWFNQMPGLLLPGEAGLPSQEAQGALAPRMQRELADFFLAVANEHPLVLVLDDLHAADALTLDVLGTLARRRR